MGQNRARGRRRGFALPLVLLVAACALLLVLASGSVSWRAYRGARHAMAAARADLAAERGVAELVRDALNDSVRERPLADTIHSQRVDAAGLSIVGRAVRPSPFTLWVSAVAGEGNGVDPTAVRATRIRAERLAPPPWPLRAALVATSTVDSTGSTIVGSSGTDVSGCFGERHPAVGAIQLLSAAGLAPVWSGTWSAARARGSAWTMDAPPDGRWRVHVIPTGDSVLTGPRRWQGVLLHDGPLRLAGTFDGRGVLIVRGPLDASAARLSIRGAVLVDDPGGQRVTLGPAMLHWDRCAVSMALATLAVPRATPFHAWVGLTP